MPGANCYFLPGYVSHITVKEKLGPKAMWREMAGVNGSYELREATDAYKTYFDAKNGDLRKKCLLLGHIHMKFNKLAGFDPKKHKSQVYDH